MVCNKGRNVPEFGSNDNSVHKQSLPSWKKMHIECDVIATRHVQAFATKTRIQQNCVIVLIVAAFSNFPLANLCMYVPDLGIKNIIARRAYFSFYFLLARSCYFKFLHAHYLFICYFLCLKFENFCLASALYMSFLNSYVRTYVVHKAQVTNILTNWREFERFTVQEYHACTNNF